jgi:hypothetical protein
MAVVFPLIFVFSQFRFGCESAVEKNQGLWFRVQGLGFRFRGQVQGSGSGFRVQGSGFRV